LFFVCLIVVDGFDDVDLVGSVKIGGVGVVVLMVVDGFDDVDLVGSVKIVVVGVVVLMVDDGFDAVDLVGSVKIGVVLMYWIVGDGLSSSEGIALVVVLDVVMLLVRCVNSIGLLWVQLKKNGHTCWCIT
jgi:hypothetical protein